MAHDPAILKVYVIKKKKKILILFVLTADIVINHVNIYLLSIYFCVLDLQDYKGSLSYV